MKQSNFIKRCPKTGRIKGINSSSLLGRILFPIAGILAIVWFLFRVIPKPHRIAYPCQQVAMSLGGTFLTYLSALILSYPLFNKLKKSNGAIAFLFVLFLVGTGSTIVVLGLENNSEEFKLNLIPVEISG